MFGKSEKPRKHTGMTLAVGALAVYGAASLVKEGKRLLSVCKDKMNTMMTKKADDCDFGV